MDDHTINHRTATDRHYAGVVMHAAPGTHEAAIGVLRSVAPAGTRVLDVGAGSGSFSRRLRDAGWSPTALDLSVDEQVDTVDGIEFIEADVADLVGAVQGTTFPTIVAIETVEHLPNPTQFLRDCFTVLEPGGVLLLTTPNILHPYSRLKFAAKGTYWFFDKAAYWSTGHITPLPEWLLREHLIGAGFEDIRSGRGGSFDVRGMRRRMVRALSRASAGGEELCSSGDGVALIMAAAKPRR